DGSFKPNANGEVVTSNGYPLQPAITIPSDATSITVGTDGTVSVQQPGSATPTQVGQIQLATFTNPSGLQSIGENQLVETGASGSATTAIRGNNGVGTIIAPYLESSNVNVVEELVRLIETQRAYEMNAKSVQTVDGMLRYLSQT